ncbi:hypothetical protein FCE95_16520 [Luteimonas gilva]|uniref:Glycosyltransferase RgtA/B/C/D-like domain-containing protein n=1 Tax=Luteimonas gilva TaxID=2572684 RepID=A0A4U5JJI9_9GAMM|nr:hypothetical protein [Luteimonas gilva]TKR29722.1 hypothetical protein FCE95_16520 [Luteimonas gilva]
MGTPAQRRSAATGIWVYWLLLACTVAVVSLTLFGNYRFVFHSDGAIKSVLAQMAWAEGRFVPTEWVYANGDLMFVGPQFFSILLHPFTGIGYGSNAAADLLVYLCIVASAFFCCRVLERPLRLAAVLGCTLIAGGVSASSFEFVIGQGIYGLFAAFALLLFSLPASEADGRPIGRFGVFCAAALAAAVCSSNPIRGWVTIVLPIVFGWIAASLLGPAPSWETRLRRLHSPTIYSSVAGALLGSAAYQWLLRPSIVNFDAAARLGLADLPVLAEHVRKLPSAWFEYFWVAGPWDSLTPAARIVQYFAWLLAVLAIAAPVWVVLTPRRHGRGLLVFAWIVLAAYGTSLGALMAASELFTAAIEIRYATFAIFGSLCVLAALVARWANRIAPARWASFALAVGALSTCLVWRAAHPSDYRDHDVVYADREALIDALERSGVGAILTTYWHSHVTTVLSEGRVVAYPVGIGNQLSAFPHHMPRAAVAGRGGAKQAVVLTRNESTAAAWGAVEYQLGAPRRKLDLGNYQVWIYDRNIVAAVLGFGYEHDAQVRPDRLRVRLSQATLPPCRAQEACETWLEVTNTGQLPLATAGSRPLRLGLQGLDANDNLVVQDLGRADFPHPLPVGATERVRVPLPASRQAEVASYRVCLLQENIAWLCDRTQAPSLSARIDAAVDPAQASIGLESASLPACAGSGQASCLHRMTVQNQGNTALVTAGSLPMRVGIQGLDAAGRVVEWDLGRADFPRPLAPGARASILISVPRSPNKPISRVRLCLLQENVAWLCDRTAVLAPPQ